MPGAWMAGSLALAVIADQWTKHWIANRPPTPRLRFVAHRSPRFERRASQAVYVLAWLLALLSATTLHRGGLWFQSTAAASGLGLALGGALGNLLDMLRLGYVVDFIDLGWWPVFNLADVAIVAGLCVAFLGDWW